MRRAADNLHTALHTRKNIKHCARPQHRRIFLPCNFLLQSNKWLLPRAYSGPINLSYKLAVSLHSVQLEYFHRFSVFVTYGEANICHHILNNPCVRILYILNRKSRLWYSTHVSETQRTTNLVHAVHSRRGIPFDFMVFFCFSNGFHRNERIVKEECNILTWIVDNIYCRRSF